MHHIEREYKNGTTCRSRLSYPRIKIKTAYRQVTSRPTWNVHVVAYIIIMYMYAHVMYHSALCNVWDYLLALYIVAVGQIGYLEQVNRFCIVLV